MEKVRDQAMLCVGRAVFFGYLAISMVMLGSMFDLVLFFRTGAILALDMAVVLLWFAQTAPHRAPEKTETWLLLEDRHRPHNKHAVQLFSQVMQEVYGYFAMLAIWIAIALGLASLLPPLTGLRYIFGN